jgi:hypothetical protein
MIPFSVLAAAKAFLCWDGIDHLGIQLVPLRSAVAYYYPPGNQHHAIVVFYDPASRDFSEPFFLLFHEAGHARQWVQLHAVNRADYFQKMMNADRGQEKMAFEREAWDSGRQLLEEFLYREQLSPTLTAHYDLYARASLLTYDDSEDRRGYHDKAHPE